MYQQATHKGVFVGQKLFYEYMYTQCLKKINVLFLDVSAM